MGLHAIREHVDDLHQEYEGKVISGHFTVGGLSTHVLFDLGADQSFLYTSFLQRSSISIEPLSTFKFNYLTVHHSCAIVSFLISLLRFRVFVS